MRLETSASPRVKRSTDRGRRRMVLDKLDSADSSATGAGVTSILTDLRSATIPPTLTAISQVAVCPRSPIGYNTFAGTQATSPVAVCPRSPIGYNDERVQQCREKVAVCPRSPIGYNVSLCRDHGDGVAVCPRSPIGYNQPSSSNALLWLRFAPDLPSATIGLRRSISPTPLRFAPDLPSATIATGLTEAGSKLIRRSATSPKLASAVSEQSELFRILVGRSALGPIEADNLLILLVRKVQDLNITRGW